MNKAQNQEKVGGAWKVVQLSEIKRIEEAISENVTLFTQSPLHWAESVKSHALVQLNFVIHYLINENARKDYTSVYTDGSVDGGGGGFSASHLNYRR